MLRIANEYIESLGRDQLDTVVERNVLDAFRRSAETPFYKWFYGRQGLDVASVRSLDDFTRTVPPVGKRDFLEFQSAGAPAEDGLSRQLHLTSGTSGIGREMHRRLAGDIAALGTGGAYEFIWAGLVPGDRVLLTMPYSQTMAGPYFQEACAAAGLVPINGFFASSEDRVAQLSKFGCAGMVTTPSHLHRLTLIAREAGLDGARDLPELKAIFLSGESYGLDWAERMQTFWGASLCEGWGATQTLGVVMATCEAGVMTRAADGERRRGVLHGLDHRCFIEIVDPETLAPCRPGAFGEVVITNLRARGLPCIRFRMGDKIRRLEHGSCGCGRALSCYEAGTIGRIDDMIKIRGMNVWPSAVDEVVFSMPVADYQARVFTDDAGREAITLRVEPSEHIADPGRFAGELISALRARVGIRVDVSLLDPASIEVVQFKARRWIDERAVGA